MTPGMTPGMTRPSVELVVVVAGDVVRCSIGIVIIVASIGSIVVASIGAVIIVVGGMWGFHCHLTHMPWLSLYRQAPLICLISGWAAEPKFAKDGWGNRGVEASGVGDGGVDEIGTMADWVEANRGVEASAVWWRPTIGDGGWCWWCCKLSRSETMSATATAAACIIELASAGAVGVCGAPSPMDKLRQRRERMVLLRRLCQAPRQ